MTWLRISSVNFGVSFDLTSSVILGRISFSICGRRLSSSSSSIFGRSSDSIFLVNFGFSSLVTSLLTSSITSSLNCNRISSVSCGLNLSSISLLRLFLICFVKMGVISSLTSSFTSSINSSLIMGFNVWRTSDSILGRNSDLTSFRTFSVSFFSIWGVSSLSTFGYSWSSICWVSSSRISASISLRRVARNLASIFVVSLALSSCLIFLRNSCSILAELIDDFDLSSCSFFCINFSINRRRTSTITNSCQSIVFNSAPFTLPVWINSHISSSLFLASNVVPSCSSICGIIDWISSYWFSE